MIKTVLWDVDDTLLDFEAGARNALRSALEEQGIAFSEKRYQMYREASEGLWRKLERGEISRPDIWNLRFPLFLKNSGLQAEPERLEETYREKLSLQHIPVEGAADILKWLEARGCRQYVVTNGFQDMQNKRMKDAGLNRYFQGVFASEEIGWPKPAPEFFAYCSAGIPEFDKRQTLLEGDSLTSDMKGGKQAGLRTCWYNPRGKERPFEGCCDWEIRRLDDLKQLFLEEI